MQWTIILEATTGWGERTCTPVYTLSRPMLDLQPEQVGLTLTEATTLLARLQERLVCQQADGYATCRRVCRCCYQMQPVKAYQPRVLDAPFGPVHLDSPRWQVCRCRCGWDHPPTLEPAFRDPAPALHARTGVPAGALGQPDALPPSGLSSCRNAF